MYCTTEEVRDFTGLTSSEIADDKLYSLIQRAIIRLNGQVNHRIWDEEVTSISNEKDNDIDGSNTTFYTRHYPIGDANNDGEITTADITAYSLDSDGVRTWLTVDSIDDDELGKFSLSTAPSSTLNVYLNYYHAPLEEETPHSLIKQACIELTAAMAMNRVQKGSVKSFSLGKFKIVRDQSQYAGYMSSYYGTIRQIMATQISEFIAEDD